MTHFIKKKKTKTAGVAAAARTLANVLLYASVAVRRFKDNKGLVSVFRGNGTVPSLIP